MRSLPDSAWSEYSISIRLICHTLNTEGKNSDGGNMHQGVAAGGSGRAELRVHWV